MNEQIRKMKPSRPVIVRQWADGVQVESNEFEIRFRGQPIGRVKFSAGGLAAVETHEVTAWVEFNDDVQIIDATPKASPKRPNSTVKT